MRFTIKGFIGMVSPVVKSYRLDLGMDVRALRQYPGIPFLHWCGETGSNMTFLSENVADFPNEGDKVAYLFGECDRWELARKPLEMAECMGRNGRPVCHHCDGNEVRLVSLDRGIYIARAYRDAMHRRFRAQLDAQQRRLVAA